MVDIEELKKMNYEQGAELLTAAGYVKGEESTADERRPSGFAKDEYWRLYDADAYAAGVADLVNLCGRLRGCVSAK